MGGGSWISARVCMSVLVWGREGVVDDGEWGVVVVVCAMYSAIISRFSGGEVGLGVVWE